MIQDQLKEVLNQFKGLQNADKSCALDYRVNHVLTVNTASTGIVYSYQIKTSKGFNQDVTSITFWPKYQANPYKQTVEGITWQFIPTPKPMPVKKQASTMNVRIGDRTVSVKYTD